MRKSCLFCVSKHISQAVILTIEAALGYPIHLWLAAGHLAEAESEACSKYPEFAAEIRNVRLTLIGQKGTFENDSLMELLRKARSLAEQNNNQKEEERVQQILNTGVQNKDGNYLPANVN